MSPNRAVRVRSTRPFLSITSWEMRSPEAMRDPGTKTVFSTTHEDTGARFLRKEPLPAWRAALKSPFVVQRRLIPAERLCILTLSWAGEREQEIDKAACGKCQGPGQGAEKTMDPKSQSPTQSSKLIPLSPSPPKIPLPMLFSCQR
jgi:hypothetical protein